MRKYPRSMAFLVLAYNHEDYIVEHLESIKYLIETYARDIFVDIVVNDDCSRDGTVELVDVWFSRNETLFRNVVKIYNKKNIGTCASVLNMLEHVTADALKLTAGDDVYSYENIFEYADIPDGVSILSGIPVGLVDGLLFENKKDILGVISSQIIYGGSPLLDRFKFLSNNNAPNIMYNKKFLMASRVMEFLRGFDVVEDWPVQISIAENFPGGEFCLVDKVFVYYRRTQGSTYIVAGSRFFGDKVRVFKYLIDGSSDFFDRLILRNRLFLFEAQSPLLNKVFNFSFYIFIVRCFFNFFPILTRLLGLKIDMSAHAVHYKKIRQSAASYRL